MERLVNFRDIGGVTTLDGRKVVEKQFLRSVDLHDLVDPDRDELLDYYKLKWDIDLRTSVEIKEAPDDILQGVVYEHIDIVGDNVSNAAVLSNLKNANPDIDPKKLMIESYIQNVSSKQGRHGYSKFLKGFLEHPNEATLFHCQTGKDRTGIGAALILSSLNVSKEDIYKDYLKTNEQRKATNKEILEEYRKQGVSEQWLEILSITLDVDKSYLDAAFNKIEEEYGTVDNYFVEGLELPVDFKERMINLYTTVV